MSGRRRGRRNTAAADVAGTPVIRGPQLVLPTSRNALLGEKVMQVVAIRMPKGLLREIDLESERAGGRRAGHRYGRSRIIRAAVSAWLKGKRQ